MSINLYQLQNAVVLLGSTTATNASQDYDRDEAIRGVLRAMDASAYDHLEGQALRDRLLFALTMASCNVLVEMRERTRW